jgi:hypothetical protein
MQKWIFSSSLPAGQGGCGVNDIMYPLKKDIIIGVAIKLPVLK